MPDPVTLLNVDLDDVAIETTPVDPGIYDLRCLGAEIRTSTKGNQYINSRFAVIKRDDGIKPSNADTVYHITMLPTADDDEDQRERRLRGIKQLLVALGEASGKLDLEMLTGRTCTAMLDKEHDEQYGERNRLKRFILDK